MIHHFTSIPSGIDAESSSASNPEIEALRRSLEEERRLRFELQHRVSNNLMGLIGLIEIVERTIDSPERRLQYIRDRVQALIAAHRILTACDDGDLTLRELAESLIPTAAPGDVVIDCPAITLPASRGAKLALVINEWVLNSTKYGALTSSNGRVTMRVTCDDADDVIHIRWTEEGGPRIEHAPAPGLGTTLLRQLVQTDLGGTIDMNYPPSGVDHQVSVVRDPSR